MFIREREVLEAAWHLLRQPSWYPSTVIVVLANEWGNYHDDGPQGIVDKNDGTERQEGRAHDFILSTGLDRLQLNDNEGYVSEQGY